DAEARRGRVQQRFLQPVTLMRKLKMREGALVYSGFFAQPAFSLWKRDAVEIVEEIYKLLLPFGADLSDINVSISLEDFTESTVDVSVNDSTDITLSPKGVEVGVEGFISDGTTPLFELLQAVSDWLHNSEDGFKYEAHLFEYSGHGALDEGTSQAI